MRSQRARSTTTTSANARGAFAVTGDEQARAPAAVGKVGPILERAQHGGGEQRGVDALLDGVGRRHGDLGGARRARQRLVVHEADAVAADAGAQIGRRPGDGQRDAETVEAGARAERQEAFVVGRLLLDVVKERQELVASRRLFGRRNELRCDAR